MPEDASDQVGSLLSINQGVTMYVTHGTNALMQGDYEEVLS